MNGPVQSVHQIIKQVLACSLFLLAVCVSAPAFSESYADQQSLDWHYSIRPDDKLKAIAERLLKPQYDWPSIAHYNHIKDIERLQVGSILKIPLSWLKHQPRPAKVVTFEGVALVKRRQNTRYQDLTGSTALYVGDEVLTREGRVVIGFADQSTIKLEEYSHLIFNKLSKYNEIGMVDTRMRLRRGGLRTIVSPLDKGSRYEISTPSAVAAVRGTDFRLRTNKLGTTLEVIEGAVQFVYEHGTELIKAGKGARALTSRAMLERINLRSLPKYTQTEYSRHNPIAGNDAPQWRGLPSDLSEAKNQLAIEQANNKQGGQGAAANDEYSLADNSVPDASTDNPGLEDVGPDSAALDLPLPGSIVDSFTSEFTWKVAHPKTLSLFELSKDEKFERLALPTKWNEAQSYRIEESIAPGNYYWRVRTLSAGKTESTSSVRSVSIQGKLDTINILTVNYIGDQVGIFWHTVDNAKGYVLQVSDDKEFRRLLKEETLSKTRAFLKLPEGKNFYARVKGLGDEVFSAEFGPHKEIYVEPKPE